MAPGALVFSPPDKSGKVFQYHFCAECYVKITALLIALAPGIENLL